MGNGLAARLSALAAGSRLTVVGLDPAAFSALLPAGTRPLLRLELAGALSADAALAAILDDLAELALAAWPDWPPSPLAPWRRAADRLAARGIRPRFSQRLASEIQFRALYPASGAPALVFLLDPARADRAAPLISALEWIGRHGAAVVALLPEMPPVAPPWDRVLHGALVLESQRAPAASRLLPPSSGPQGSAAERRLRLGLQAEPDLAELFEDEVTVQIGPLGPAPRVDLLWRDGRIVVELDGPEHERDPNYGADRHRDYELLVAGYLVLRLTNAEVELDLSRALDKIRRVVNLRRPA